MERKNGVVYAAAKKMKSGGQGSIVFMQVYLHHKYPENFWHHDPRIILQKILDTLDLKDPLRTEISKHIQAAVNHVHIWHKKSRISSAFHSTASKQGFINSTSGDGTPIQSQTISSNISSTSSAMRPEHTQIHNHACSIQSELSSVQDLLLLLRAREGSNFPIDGCSFVCTYLFEISSFAQVLQIHNQISTILPMMAGITHDVNKEKSQVFLLIAHAAEFIKVVMMPDAPTMVRSCFLCTFMVYIFIGIIFIGIEFVCLLIWALFVDMQEHLEKIYPSGLTPKHDVFRDTVNLTTVQQWRSCDEEQLKLAQHAVRNTTYTYNDGPSIGTKA